jgi:biopolymer transport protein ExbB/TolQ
MSDTVLLTIAASLVATLFGLLVTIIGWLGNKFYSKLDEISRNLVTMAGELHERINGLDRRVTVVETRVERRKDDHV